MIIYKRNKLSEEKQYIFDKQHKMQLQLLKSGCKSLPITNLFGIQEFPVDLDLLKICLGIFR